PQKTITTTHPHVRHQLQREIERAARAFASTLRPAPPSVRFDESLTDSQTEPCPADAPRDLTPDAVEPVEDSIELCCRHSKPLVGDCDRQLTSVAVRRQCYAPAVWRILHRVREQVLNHLVQALSVRIEPRV